jgi:hypothetical protein
MQTNARDPLPDPDNAQDVPLNNVLAAAAAVNANLSGAVETNSKVETSSKIERNWPGLPSPERLLKVLGVVGGAAYLIAGAFGAKQPRQDMTKAVDAAGSALETVQKDFDISGNRAAARFNQAQMEAYALKQGYTIISSDKIKEDTSWLNPRPEIVDMTKLSDQAAEVAVAVAIPKNGQGTDGNYVKIAESTTDNFVNMQEAVALRKHLEALQQQQ